LLLLADHGSFVRLLQGGFVSLAGLPGALALLLVLPKIVIFLQSGFASLGDLLEALALLLVSSKIVIFLQGGFASLVGRLDVFFCYPNDRHSFHLRSPVFSEKSDVMPAQTSPLIEIARVLVRLDHVDERIVNANHSIV
jgi:hypothetical protein